MCFDKRKRTPSKKSPQIYLSTSEADTKAKTYKKRKNVYSDICHNYLHNKQIHNPRFFENDLMTYKQ